MTDVSFDLAGVPPKKLEEARCRAAVVAEFAEADRPTRALAQAYAARLGLGEAQFYMLVRLYREKGTIVRSPGVGLANRRLRMDARVDAVIAAGIAAVGPDAPLSDVAAAVYACCDALKLTRPSETAIRTRLRRARRDGSGSDAYPPLVLDRSPLELNVETSSGAKAAWLTALIHAPTSRVLGHHVSVGDAGPVEAALAILDAIGANASRPLPPGAIDDAIVLFRDLRPGWDSLCEALTEGGLTVVGPVKERVRLGTALYRLLGDRITRIAFRPRLPVGAPAREGGDGVDVATARAAVKLALQTRGAVNAVAEAPADERLARLADALSELAAGASA